MDGVLYQVFSDGSAYFLDPQFCARHTLIPFLIANPIRITPNAIANPRGDLENSSFKLYS